MAKSWKYTLVTIWFYYVMVASILLFSRGFLLKREVVTEKTRCFSGKENVIDRYKETHSNTDKHSEHRSVHNGLSDLINTLMNNNTVCAPSTAKVILMIVDALRYDFIKYNESLDETQSLGYQNKIPIVHELLKLKPQNSRIFKFIADPPTTTMQRLKGMTTGSLPTFIDVGSNFATPEINEDNFIDQMVTQNKNVVFMGDDTWTGLYPKRFVREFAYPSFNVWDLDTVDNGIVYHLIPEIHKNDWHLIIAHFLGVDHCGHKYGPYHPEMSRKLGEVNTVIRHVVDAMDKETILFVFGDHGMTSTGDHGGESRDEVTAALFVYSSAPLFPKELAEETDTVSQVDLVPTLSFILGVPIPFSNLGKIILGLLPYIDSGLSQLDWKYAQMALWRNAHQVKDYLTYYSENSHQFPPEKIRILDRKYDEILQQIGSVSNLEAFKLFSQAVEEYLLLAKNMCSEIWVQFDLLLMFFGLFFMIIFILFATFIIEGIPFDKMRQIINSGKTVVLITFVFFISLSTSILLQKFHLIENVDIVIYSLSCTLSAVFMFAIIIQNWSISVNQLIAKIKLCNIVSLCTRLILIITFVGTFSNSYVVEESTVLSFLLISMSLIVLYSSSNMKELGKQRNDKSRLTLKGTHYKLKVILLVALFGLVIRMSHYYWRCREEQKSCNMSEWIKFPSFTIFSAGGVRYFHTLVYLALLVTIFRMWLRSCGNLVGFSVTVTIVRYVPTVIAICISAFWVLQRLPKNAMYSLKPWQIQVWPCVIFFLLGISVVILYICPLSVFKLPKTKVTMDGVYGQENIITHLFNQVKESLDRRNREKNFNSLKDFPVVYGLATVYSAAVIIFSLFVLLLISLLLGDVLAPSAALMFLASILLLAIHTMSRYERTLMSNQLFNVTWSSVLWWCLLSSYFFYATGHQPTFSSIQWDAAFVGTGGQFSSHIIPAILIGINTFASQLWFGLAVPLLLISPFTFVVMFPKFIKKDEVGAEMKKGELVLYEKEGLFHQGLFTLCFKYVLCCAIRVLSCMLAATIHCRHLMVWKVFAPKLIFEILSFFVMLIGVLLGYTLVLRVTKSLKSMMKNLEKDN